MNRRQFISSLGTVLGGLTIYQLSYAKSIADSAVFTDGDTVCFVGDSITHNGAWQLFISTFIMTRFPGKKIRYINCGISGDTAEGVLKRWESDIMANKPTVAIVMLGMNDVNRGLYSEGDVSEAILEKRKIAGKNYQKNMEEIIRRLQRGQCRKIILVSPSPFDQTAKIDNQIILGSMTPLPVLVPQLKIYRMIKISCLLI